MSTNMFSNRHIDLKICIRLFSFMSDQVLEWQPMVFLFHSSYGMPGLPPLMNVLFEGRCDFHLSSSDRDMSWNVWNRPSGSFMVDMGISSNIMKSPSPKCYMTFWDMTIYNDTLNWSDITPICELITELDLITDFDLITKFGRFP